MMRLLFKGLGLFVLIACLVWLGVLWHWQSSRHDMSTEDIVLYLGVLPLGLFGFVLLARWAWRSAAARADDRAAQARSATGAAAPAPEAPVLVDSARQATCQVLAAALSCAAASSARELLQAAQAGKPRPGLDRSLRRADGLPAITARVAAADEADITDALVAALTRLRLRRPEFAGREPGERLQRALGLLGPVLAEALSALAPWAAQLGGRAAEPAETEAGPGGTATADTRSQVAAHATRRAPARPEPPVVRVLVAWPEGADEFERELARQWLTDTLRGLSDGTVAEERWRVHAQAVGSGPELLLEADRLLQEQHRQGRADLLLVAACHSDLDSHTVLRLDDAQALFGTVAPRGRVPGEGAAALVLAAANWPADPMSDRPPTHLHRPAIGQRSKSIDAPGRTSSDVAVQLLQRALAAARLEAAEVPALATDADQHTPRGPELFGATLAELPHLDAAEDLRLAGPLCGHLGPCGALASVAMAVQHAADTGQPCLALSVGDPVWRAAAVARPDSSAAEDAAAHTTLTAA